MFWKRRKPKLIQDKLDLIDFSFTSFKVHSFADIGGVWGVDGGYTFHSLNKHTVTNAMLINRYFTNATKEQSETWIKNTLIKISCGKTLKPSGSGALQMQTSNPKLNRWAFVCNFLRIAVRSGIQKVLKIMHMCSANNFSTGILCSKTLVPCVANGHVGLINIAKREK